jgi:hypothetical protein
MPQLGRLRAAGNKILDFHGLWTSGIFSPNPTPQSDSPGRGTPWCAYERWVDDAGVKRVGDTVNPQFISRLSAEHLQIEFSVVITFQVVYRTMVCYWLEIYSS